MLTSSRSKCTCLDGFRTLKGKLLYDMYSASLGTVLVQGTKCMFILSDIMHYQTQDLYYNNDIHI